MEVPTLEVAVTVAVPLVATLNTMALEVAVAGEAHTELDVSTTVIDAPFVSDEDEEVEAVAPLIAEPLLYHWYDGEEPPFVGVAVKVTLWPAHILLPPLDTADTVGASTPVTVIVIELEVALVVLTHCELETILHDITSPLVIPVVL